MVRRGTIADRRDELTRFIRATAEGNYLALTDEKRAKAVLAKQAGITDPKILDISYNDFKLLSPPNIEPSDAGGEKHSRAVPRCEPARSRTTSTPRCSTS